MRSPPAKSPAQDAAARAALAVAMASFAGQSLGTNAPARYRPPSEVRYFQTSERLAAKNRAAMLAWVDHQIAAAPSKPDPDAFLMACHDHLGGMMDKLGGCEPRLSGLTAFDLGNAQSALAASAVRLGKAA